ncbi:MAG: hypothetical protein CM1200mP26_03030 [Acidimicrobiales bacterium]|nr:MAG: hypothetical protein CM1200mP26_03030 [Acidimicrobiales bacterium]
MNLYDLSRDEQRDLRVARLPHNLEEALDEMEPFRTSTRHPR